MASKRNQLILSFLPPTLLMETRTLKLFYVLCGLIWIEKSESIQLAKNDKYDIIIPYKVKIIPNNNWRVPKSIRLIQNDLSFWIISITHTGVHVVCDLLQIWSQYVLVPPVASQQELTTQVLHNRRLRTE